MKTVSTALYALGALLVSTAIAAAFPATSTADTNVRSGPGTRYAVIDRLADGDVVDVVNRRNGWYQIAGGGWVKASLLVSGGYAEPQPYYYEDYGPSYGYGYGYGGYYGRPGWPHRPHHPRPPHVKPVPSPHFPGGGSWRGSSGSGVRQNFGGGGPGSLRPVPGGSGHRHGH
jgi:uncharacterized protein YraI